MVPWCLFLLIVLTACASARLDRNGTVYLTNNQYQIIDKTECSVSAAVACGYFVDSLNETGWGQLEIKTMTKQSATFTDYNRMYAAGLLEGWLTPFEIYYHWTNVWNQQKETYEPYLDQLTNWTTIQYQWTMKQIATHNSTSDSEYKYWQYVHLILAQLDGIQNGYNIAAKEPDINLPQLDSFPFLFLNSYDEFADLLHVFDPDKYNLNWNNMTDDEFMTNVLETSSCSAIIKTTPTLDDIFFSHSTWTKYYTMNKIYKHYKFDLDLNILTYHWSMSSRPAALSSIDDYYLMDSGLASMETTNGIYNNSLWELVVPESLFTWQRALVSNALASTGKEWVETFSKHNSGTYNNQWMVLNYKAFEPNQPLPDGLLFVLEQIPGNCSYSDETQVLEKGYWGSYNVAALEYIYNVSGTAQQAAIHGPAASYDLAPRARIFRRDANNANNLTMIQQLMRYNNYQNDPIENNDPSWAIMSRKDLYSGNKSDHISDSGGVDTKVANLEMLKSVYAMIQIGPTHDQQPVFKWSQFPNVSHIGLPSQYDFKWITAKATF